MKYAHGFIMLCFVVVISAETFTGALFDLFGDIIHSYFTGSGIVVWLPCVTEVSLKDVGKSPIT